jgi:hypothetical protein
MFIVGDLVTPSLMSRPPRRDFVFRTAVEKAVNGDTAAHMAEARTALDAAEAQAIRRLTARVSGGFGPPREGP